MKIRFSLLAKIYLATAVALTALFAAAGWFFLYQASYALHDGVEKEVRASLRTVDASLESRTEHLATASSLLASMSDVRAAFGTRDNATVRDTAGELWARAQAGHRDVAGAAFVVAGPGGIVQASVGAREPAALSVGQALPANLLDPARRAFPKQSGAFAQWDGAVWQVLATPVYVDSGAQSALLSILLAAHPITQQTLGELKQRTGGIDFMLRAGDRTVLSTTAADFSGQEHFAVHPTILRDGAGNALAELWAVRSFQDVEARILALRRTMVVAWLIAMTIGLALSYLLSRRMVRPIRALNEAAREVSRENYSVRVPQGGDDELGVLSRTFNHMAASIEQARDEQVRSGQIAAVGRLAASIAHDLRNPLAAVVGGSEMLAEFELPPDQMKQTAGHVHKAAKRMEQLLLEIGQVARAKPGEREICVVGDLVAAAVDTQQAKAEVQGVTIRQSVEGPLRVRCEKSRVERVIGNLIANALEVMPGGGEIAIDVRGAEGEVRIDVSDTGPGIPAGIREKLFQPFVTAGKKNGLGLGLALARQTMIEHDGGLDLIDSSRGAHFRLRLPLAA
jgi:signal transduction histidine kinase